MFHVDLCAHEKLYKIHRKFDADAGAFQGNRKNVVRNRGGWPGEPFLLESIQMKIGCLHKLRSFSTRCRRFLIFPMEYHVENDDFLSSFSHIFLQIASNVSGFFYFEIF